MENREIILLVDDNPANLRAGKNVLTAKYDVFTAPSAEKMFAILEKNRPALILLDIEMPVMSGYEAIKLLKAKPETTEIPVIFLTGKTATDNELEGLSLGAVDYITKPFVPPLLLKRIEVHILMQAQKQVIRRAFSTYLSEDVVEEVLSDPDKLQLGGVKRNISALFTDIQNFTSISQNMDPEDVIRLLNEYLSVMSGIILEQHGTIDKYEGDAIISFFGAPLEVQDHAFRAALSAINIKRAENGMNKRFTKECISPLPIYTRIGINTGEMVAGNMGTKRKMNYTIIGNNVNIASRLEGVNKLYGTWVLASEASVRAAGERIVSRRLDRVRVVGIDEPVRLYELLELRTRCTDDIFTLVRLSEDALVKFEARDWAAAAAAFEAVLKHAPEDGPAKLYLRRCENFCSVPPRENWDGVFNLSEK